MTRYQVLRRLQCDVFTAAFIAFLNWLFNVKEGYIGVMHMVIQYDPKEPFENDIQI